MRPIVRFLRSPPAPGCDFDKDCSRGGGGTAVDPKIPRFFPPERLDHEISVQNDAPPPSRVLDLAVSCHATWDLAWAMAMGMGSPGTYDGEE